MPSSEHSQLLKIALHFMLHKLTLKKLSPSLLGEAAMTVLGRTTASTLKGATESHRYLQRTIRKGAIYWLLCPEVVKTTDAPCNSVTATQSACFCMHASLAATGICLIWHCIHCCCMLRIHISTMLHPHCVRIQQLLLERLPTAFPHTVGSKAVEGVR